MPLAGLPGPHTRYPIFLSTDTQELSASEESNAVSTKASLAFVYAGYFFRYLYLLILIPFYGRVLGAEAYGKVLSAMSLFNVVWLIAEYGFPIVGSRETASTTDRSAIGREFGSQLYARAATSVLAVLAGIGGTYASPILRDEPVFGFLATAMGVVSAFNLGWYFAGMHQFRTSILMEIGGFIISLTLILSLVKGPSDAVWVLAAQLVSGTVMTIAAFWVAIAGLGRQHIQLVSPLRHMAAATTLFTASRVPLLMTNGTSFMLSLVANAHQVGVYGAAERLATLGLSLLQPAGQVLAPTVTRRLGSNATHDSARRVMRLGTLMTTGFGFACMAIALLASPVAIPLIFGPGFEDSIPIMLAFALMFPFAAFNQAIRSYILFPLREDTAILRSTIIGVLVSLLAILLLAEAYGGLGMAIARVIGEAITAALLVVSLFQVKDALKRSER